MRQFLATDPRRPAFEGAARAAPVPARDEHAVDRILFSAGLGRADARGRGRRRGPVAEMSSCSRRSTTRAGFLSLPLAGGDEWSAFGIGRSTSRRRLREIAFGWHSLRALCDRPDSGTKPPQPSRNAMACGLRVKASKIARSGAFLWRERPLPLTEL